MGHEADYWSCNHLLTLKDANRKTPGVYIVDGNRTAGKSVSFKKKLIDDFLKVKDINQFYYLYRYKCDMENCAESFFSDIGRIFYPSMIMTSKKLFGGAVVELSLDGRVCGYCIPMSASVKIKRIAPIFVRVKHGFFDEYQDESDNYLPDEISKLMSIRASIARGEGEQTRHVPLYMASNTVSMLNPYYEAFGINKRLQPNTKILRGDGWVFERTYNLSAMKAYQEDGFNRAFKRNAYYNYASQNVYLNDNLALIGKPAGFSRYVVTVRFNNEYYNVRQYDTCVYVSQGADESFPVRICFNVNDVIDDKAIRVPRTHPIVANLRGYFNRGLMRFENLKCKNMTLDLLSFT